VYLAVIGFCVREPLTALLETVCRPEFIADSCICRPKWQHNINLRLFLKFLRLNSILGYKFCNDCLKL